MAFGVYHYPYNITGRLSDSDSVFSIHEDKGASQVLSQSLLEFALRFQLKTKII